MSSVSTTHPHIFLSHSSKDIEFAKRLAKDLCSAINNEQAVWYDTQELKGGDLWWHIIREEIRSSNIFLVILSPDSMDSNWVNSEVDIAWRQRQAKPESKGKLIIPILYRSCQIRDDLDTLQIISFLSPKPYEEALNELLQAINNQERASKRLASTIGVEKKYPLLTRRNMFIGMGGVIATGAGITWWIKNNSVAQEPTLSRNSTRSTATTQPT